MNTEKQQKAAAAEFVHRWEGRGYEKGESQRFWLDLLGNVYGVEKPTEFVEFEDQVHLDNTSFIDAMIPSTAVMIEQKSLGKDLRKPIRQSDGTLLTPYQQAQRYILGLPRSRHPRWIVTCNFAEFDIYDMENPNGEPQRVLLSDLPAEYYRLQFLVETGNEHLERELQVSMKAGELVGRIYDDFAQFYDLQSPTDTRWLNILCVRLVFCLYAEDAGIFGRHDQFHDYLAHYPVEDMRMALMRLFTELNTPPERRSKYDKPDLAAFPYTNGGLFAEEIDVPQFTNRLRYTLLQRASLDFDWSEISPTIFGGVFESTLNPETRRSGGMHYTSIENIHRVIDPLFLDRLSRELDDILDEPVVKTRLRRLHDYQDRLAALTFLDPACGSGNFLTETYLSLRRLENRAIRAIYSVEQLDAFVNPIKVSIHQFYGIEVNDFAVSVAQAALWISESQMMTETERIVHHDIDFLPLRSYTNIREANALRTDWLSLFTSTPPDGSTTIRRPDYIIGNPPFVGFTMQSKAQKDDILHVFVDGNGRPFKTAGKIDYVAAWYYKAAQMMQGTQTRTALVSTNSITQGEQVAAIWKPLKELFGIHIDFAHRTFRWDSEANLKAHVHCVIVGFSCAPNPDSEKTIYDNGQVIKASNINAYLVDAPDVFVESRNQPISEVPSMRFGSMPRDGGWLILSEEERNELLRDEPLSAKWIHPYTGAYEFLNNKKRYCLWMVAANPSELRKCPKVMRRVNEVRESRLKSAAASTRKFAETPTLFCQIAQPDSNYLLVPRVSSERRRYVPMGFMSKDMIANDQVQIIPDASLYHFGVLESNVHMAWMRAVCGRLKSDYRYSKDVVYNNFPWPEPTEEQRRRIEATAQAIIDARAQWPDSSLADLYDPATMPSALLEAHRANDRAVLAAYGFPVKTTEPECVSRLFDLYARLA